MNTYLREWRENAEAAQGAHRELISPPQAGVVHLDPERDEDQKVGHVPNGTAQEGPRARKEAKGRALRGGATPMAIMVRK